MNDRFLIDTNVAVDYLRDVPEAIDYVNGLDPRTLFMSVVSVAELYSGVRDGDEMEELNDFLDGLTLLEVDRAIATQAGLYCRKYGRSHAVDVPDALVAATSEAVSATVVTLNVKHFPMLADVIVPYGSGAPGKMR